MAMHPPASGGRLKKVQNFKEFPNVGAAGVEIYQMGFLAVKKKVWSGIRLT
jgi:hypothetical protein